MTKSVLITGCSSGIGNAACELLAERGWKVFAGSRDPSSLKFSHAGVSPMTIDVNDPQSIASCFAGLDAAGVALDCLVNNAGYGLLLPFEDTPLPEIENLFRVNVFGLMEASRQAAARMRGRGSGTIVNVSSVLGRVGAPWYAAYAASKWAVEGFSESLAHELRPFGVRVKIVEPGGVRTGFHPHAYAIDKFRVTGAYVERYGRKRASHDKSVAKYADPEDAALLVAEAAEDGTDRLRFAAREARKIALGRRLLGDEGLWKRMLKAFGS